MLSLKTVSYLESVLKQFLHLGLHLEIVGLIITAVVVNRIDSVGLIITAVVVNRIDSVGHLRCLKRL